MLESKDRIGGAIWTHRVGGFTLEGGPDSFITNKPWGVDLCRTLGLGDQLVDTDPQHRRSFVVREGRLVPVPEGFVLMAPNRIGPILTTPILSLKGKLRMLLDLVLPAQGRRGGREPRRRSSSAGSAARRSTGWSSRSSAGSTRPTPTS